MINVNRHSKNIVLSNKKMQVELEFSKGLYIKRWQHKALTEGYQIDKYHGVPFVLDIEGRKIMGTEFEVTDISVVSDSTQEMLSIMLFEAALKISARICLINDSLDEIYLLIQLAIDWKDGDPREMRMHLPLLANFRVCSGENKYYYPANPVSMADATAIIEINRNFPMPLGVFKNEFGPGFSIEFVSPDEYHAVWAQNRSLEFHNIGLMKELNDHNILIRPGRTLSDTVELRFSAIEDGWIGFFDRWRKKCREKLILEEYEREDLKWYRNTLLQHFAFIYGKEIYNYNKEKIEIEELIKEGEKFGGYDLILLWHQYPRLGVDSRNQWRVFDDFPGGIEGIRDIVDRAHKLGVKIALPFKPWDVGLKESVYDSSVSIAKLIEATGVDAIFLDCMDSVPKSFRAEIDRVKPGLVFCSEVHPYRKNNVEMVTGSWDQYWGDRKMPRVDLFRYVMPEHIAPTLARWHVGIKKDMIITRAIFNGVGIVIWQDVFGTWLPYNDDQKEKIKKWKAIWKENLDLYNCKYPVPMYPTLKEGLYCNYFRSDDGESIIYSLYNDTDETIDGELVIHKDPEKDNVEELWNGAAAKITGGLDQFAIASTVEKNGVAVLKVTKKG